jgi:hypothetical protein
MAERPISDLRRRMLADMTIRSFSDKTKRDYIRHVEMLSAFLGRPPDTAIADDLRRFLLHQRSAILIVYRSIRRFGSDRCSPHLLGQRASTRLRKPSPAMVVGPVSS